MTTLPSLMENTARELVDACSRRENQTQTNICAIQPSLIHWDSQVCNVLANCCHHDELSKMKNIGRDSTRIAEVLESKLSAHVGSYACGLFHSKLPAR